MKSLVEFTIHMSDLRAAASQLKVNRGQQQASDTADILVSECVATFRAVGTETEVPVSCDSPGSVRLSLATVRNIMRVAGSFKKKELRLKFEPGIFWIETFSQRHLDIELGIIPDQQLQIPIDVSVLDILALAEILGPDRIVQEGMRARVEEAIRIRTLATAEAIERLAVLDIKPAQLNELIDQHINESANKLRSAQNVA